MAGDPPPRTRRPQRVFALLLAGAVIGGVLGAPAASGHYGLWHDDPAGDAAVYFDVSGVRLFRKTDPLRGVVRVRTHAPIDLGGAPTITVFVDSRGGSRPDRTMTAMFDGGSFGLACFGVVNHETGRQIDECQVRARERMWQITFPWRALDATRHVQWWIETSDGYDEPDTDDRAPDEGRLEH